MASRKLIKYSLLSLGLIALLGFGAYSYFKEDAPTFMTTQASFRDIKEQVFATGTLAGKVEVDVGAQVSGQIKKLHVQTGDEVKEGQLLCEIDPEIQENELRTAKAQEKLISAQIRSQKAELKRLELEFTRQKGLLQTEATSKQEYELAEANLEVAKANLEALEAQLEQAQIAIDDAQTNLGYTKILAPMDGTVYAIPVEEGQTVNANQTTPTILKLAKLDVMTVETEISEADVVHVKEGMPCSFTILGLNNQSFKSKLYRIDPAPKSAENETSSSSSSSSTEAIYYNALLDVENPQGLLRIDMTAQVTIDIAAKDNVLALPLTTLRFDDYAGKGKVYVLENDLVVERDVELGIRDEQYVEVLSGLSENDLIVIGDDVKTSEDLAMQGRRGPRGPF